MQTKRSLENLLELNLKRFSPLDEFSNQPIFVETKTPLWSESAAAEQFLLAGRVHNLRLAVKNINNLEIPANAVFSFWKNVGRAKSNKNSSCRLKRFINSRIGEKTLKFIFASLLCVLFASNSFAQIEETVVEEIQLTRAANGTLGEPTTIFTTNDIPIYCLVALRSSGKAVAVKMYFVALKAAGLKTNAVVVSVGYKTNGRETGVNFDGSPGAKVWAAGKYRVDVLLDGKTAKSLEFEIQKSAKEIEKPKQAPPNSKSKTKPRKN